MTMKFKNTESSCSSLSSSCSTDGNSMEINHAFSQSNYNANSVTNRKAKSSNAKSSSEEPNSSDEDGSRSSVNTGSFQEEKQLPHSDRKFPSLKPARKDPAPLLQPAENTVDASWDSRAKKGSISGKTRAWVCKQASAAGVKYVEEEHQELEEEGGTNPMDKEVSSLLQALQERSPPATLMRAVKTTTTTKDHAASNGLRQEPANITLVKSSSVSATKADAILKLDYNNITASSNIENGLHVNKLGYKLSTGESPLNVQKRYGSQGPASLRTSFTSPGTPSRSSFSGVPTSMQLINNKAYMVGRIAVNEGTGKLLPLYNLPPPSLLQYDHQADPSSINPGRLSVTGFSSRAAPPSKWDDAEKWLVNASPSHPSQLPPHPSKQAPNYSYPAPNYTNPAPNHSAESKIKNPTNYNKRVINMAVSSSDPSPAASHKAAHSSAHTSGHADDTSYIAHMQYQSRSLVPLPSSNSSDSQVQYEDLAAATMSDSELSNTQDECRSVFVRSTSHKHIKEASTESGTAKHRNYNKSQRRSSTSMMNINNTSSYIVAKEELHISSPVALQLERLKLAGSTSNATHHEQLPKMHDVYAVETTAIRHAGAFGDAATSGDGELADGGGNSLTRLVVQAGKVVGRWGAPGAMRDASTDVSPKVSMSRRDMGTQMTPVASSKTSRSATPLKNSSPVRHNTPARAKSACTSAHSPARASILSGADAQVESFQMAKLDGSHVTQNAGHAGSESTASMSTTSQETSSCSWKSLQENIASDHHNILQKDQSKAQDILKTQETSAAAQYTAWEDAERSKYMTKCAREEARINAWEDHQKAKGEAEMKKLEMKLERLRAQATEKIMNKVAAAHLRAEEMRAAARAQQAEQLARSLERANSISRKGGGYFPESLGVCFSIMP